MFVIAVASDAFQSHRPLTRPPESTTDAQEVNEEDQEGLDEEETSRSVPRNIYRVHPTDKEQSSEPSVRLPFCSLSSFFLFSVIFGLLCILWAIVLVDAAGRV